MLQFYTNEELLVAARIFVADCFITIAKNMGLRKLFFSRDMITAMTNCALLVIEEQGKAKPRTVMELGIVTIRLLCILCTSRTNRFYIPGETNLAERLRKRAFDAGTYTVITHIYRSLKGNEKKPFTDIRQEVRLRVLNLVEVSDLVYHVKVLDAMLAQKGIHQPALTGQDVNDNPENE